MLRKSYPEGKPPPADVPPAAAPAEVETTSHPGRSKDKRPGGGVQARDRQRVGRGPVSHLPIPTQIGSLADKPMGLTPPETWTYFTMTSR